jgi:hypothetical protein
MSMGSRAWPVYKADYLTSVRPAPSVSEIPSHLFLHRDLNGKNVS